MNNYLLYIIESGICIGLFFFTFWFFLRNKTNQELRRFFLISALILSVLIPIINIPFHGLSSSPLSEKTIYKIANSKSSFEQFINSSKINANFSNIKTNTFDQKNKKSIRKLNNNKSERYRSTDRLNLIDIIIHVYILGSICFFFSFLFQFFKVFLLIRKNGIIRKDNVNYVFINEDISPFSFFNYLFINNKNYSIDDYKKIIEHEKIHIRQLHSIDIILVELFLVIHWMNPLMWLFRSYMKRTHEYLADKGVLANGYDIDSYQALLLKQMISIQSFNITNSFNFKPLKKRLAMMTKTQILQNNKARIHRIIPLLIASLLSILLGFIISCSNNNLHSYNIVKINNCGSIINSSRSNLAYVMSSDSLQTTSMVLNEGDMIAGDVIYYYRDRNEKELNFKISDSLIYKDGRINLIKLSDEYDMLPWLQQMKESDILELESITFSSPIPNEYLPYIKFISKVKPDIGIGFEDDPENDLAIILDLFDPLWMICPEINSIELKVLEKCNNLEHLEIQLTDTIIYEPLPELPNLKHLALIEIKNTTLVNEDFLSKNKQIETLLIKESIIEDLSFLSILNDLKGLSLIVNDSLKDLNFLQSLKELEMLSLVGDDFKNISTINNLHSLKWLGLPSNISQNEFNSIIERNNKLEILEIIECEDVTNMEFLKEMNKLDALIITNSISDYTSLHFLKNLKYLSIPADDYKDSKKTDSLRNSLPGVTIVPNEGFCLGSGWILLMIPLIFFIRLLLVSKRSNLLNFYKFS